MANSCWKTGLVLSGSLIEAVLYDVLGHISEAKIKISDPKTRNVTLYPLLSWALEFDIIDKGLFNLADQIRDYRNLIHPNVYIRNKIEISEHVAKISYSVLLETIRQTQKYTKAVAASSCIELVTSITTRLCSRPPTESESHIYIPLAQKYGLKRGAKIIERSLQLGIKNETDRLRPTNSLQ